MQNHTIPAPTSEKPSLNTNVAYAIKRWSSRFENAQSRRTKDLNHSLTPHELNSTHLEHLMGQEGGVIALAVWHILIQLATRCPQRGLLVNEEGPLTEAAIAKACHLPESQVSRALDLLTSDAIGWLDIVECPRQVLVTGSMRSGRKGRPKMPEVLPVKGVESGPDFHIERMVTVVENPQNGEASPQFKTVEVLPYEFEVLLTPKSKEEPVLEHKKPSSKKGKSEHKPEAILWEVIQYWNGKTNLQKVKLLSVELWFSLMHHARTTPTMAEVLIPGIDVISRNVTLGGKAYTFEEVMTKKGAAA